MWAPLRSAPRTPELSHFLKYPEHVRRAHRRAQAIHRIEQALLLETLPARPLAPPGALPTDCAPAGPRDRMTPPVPVRRRWVGAAPAPAEASHRRGPPPPGAARRRSERRPVEVFRSMERNPISELHGPGINWNDHMERIPHLDVSCEIGLRGSLGKHVLECPT